MRAIMAWFASVKRFFASTYRELQRISWPTRAKTIRLTGIVVGACIIIGVFLYLIDLGFTYGLELLIS